MRRILPFLTAAVLLFACGSRQSAWHGKGRTVPFKYARLIHVEDCDSFRLVTIDNPWKEGATLHRYVLVSRDRALPQQLPEGTLLRVPLQRSIIFTSVHCALVSQIGAESQVAGVADLKYIKVPFVQEGCRSGRLVDCGDGMNPVVEKIIDAEADAILLSPFENSGGYGRLEDADIPLVECAEYMEQSPLARAEWMRFYGMLYGQESRSDSLFHVVDSCYTALCAAAAQSVTTRSVLVDKQTGSVWYVPGGRSTIGCMLADAHCDYPFSSDDHSGSLSLPFETVLERCGEADVWLLRYDADSPLTMNQLLSEQPGYTQLRPVRNGHVFACNVKKSLFYEETPFRPDLLLRDFIAILHAENLSDTLALRYYHKVETTERN